MKYKRLNSPKSFALIFVTLINSCIKILREHNFSSCDRKMLFTTPKFACGESPIMLFVEIELNIQTSPREIPNYIQLQGVAKYHLIGVVCFHKNKENSELNHFIFKLFDGKNFYDVDNLRNKMSSDINNELNYNGNFYRSSLAIYILNQF